MVKRIASLIFIIGIFAITVGLYGFNLLPTPSNIGINQVTINTSGEVDLAFSPTTITSQIGTESTISLTANTGNVKLVVLTVEMTYDSSKISTPTIVQGDFLTNTLSSPKVENGKITFTFAASPDSGGLVGTGTIAKIKFKPIASGSSVISFSPSTSATALDLAGERIPQNTLRSATNISIIGTPAPTSAPTTTPTSAPTITPNSNSVLVVTNTPRPTARPKAAAPVTTTKPSATPSTTTSADDYLIPITEEPTETSADPTTIKPPSFWRKVMLGWKIIFQYVGSLVGIN